MSAHIAVTVADAGWRDLVPAAPALCRRAARAALLGAGAARRADIEISVLLAGDDAVRGLNRQYRGKDTATNVLSFPGEALDDDAEGMPVMLGDIVLARETVAREAAATSLAPADHAAHLIVHGVLHLLGYDHDNDRDANQMERLETRILAGLGIADPYRSPPLAASG